MDEQLVSERLGPYDKARGPKRTKSNIGSDDPFRGDENPSEPALITVGVKVHDLYGLLYAQHAVGGTLRWSGIDGEFR
jgi:hypothetical protein